MRDALADALARLPQLGAWVEDAARADLDEDAAPAFTSDALSAPARRWPESLSPGPRPVAPIRTQPHTDADAAQSRVTSFGGRCRTVLIGMRCEGDVMHGLRLCNVVLVGDSFPVAQIDLSDFSFPAGTPEPRFRIPVVVQGGVGEYSVEVTPDRFQVTSEGKATQFRLAALQEATRDFVRDYAGRKSVLAMGHNFVGSFSPPTGTADARSFLQRLAWTPAASAALGDGASPLSVLVSIAPLAPAVAGQIKLEPLAEDPSQVFYELNISFGQTGPGALRTSSDRTPLDVDESLAALASSHQLGAELIERLRESG